ncbi:MAG TPA: helix-turn-helix transcriptional regulator [Pyrinomonadaceae bacterium]|nr:helix-turn-helix transcriptional regulator [Pyrinomonadaceae bacterium]
MFPQKRQISVEPDPKTYPLVEQIDHPSTGPAMALVALNHTPIERRLYAAMLQSLEASGADPAAVPASPVFTVRRVMELAEITNLSTVRRGLEGLVAKSSAERVAKINGGENQNEAAGETGNSDGGNGHTNGNGKREQCAGYRVRLPEEVIARRDESGTNTFTRGISGNDRSFERVIQRIVAAKNLSRREAQVALCCVEGLTNAEIGTRLLVKEQTVKFHLRHVFLKFGVKRRAELISRLLL